VLIECEHLSRHLSAVGQGNPHPIVDEVLLQANAVSAMKDGRNIIFDKRNGQGNSMTKTYHLALLVGGHVGWAMRTNATWE
jgi:hypothetical protein